MLAACATCTAAGTGPKGPGRSAMLLPAYQDAYGNERFWAQDRGHFGARPFGRADFPVVMAGLGDISPAFGAAVAVGSLLANGITPTADALRAFQRAAGISADGQYGPETRRALVSVLSATEEGRAIANRLPSAPSGGGGGVPSEGAPPPAPSPGLLARLPDWTPWAVGGVAGAVAVGLVIWKLRKRKGR